jgi:hypothetical protein
MSPIVPSCKTVLNNVLDKPSRDRKMSLSIKEIKRKHTCNVAALKLRVIARPVVEKFLSSKV